MNEMIEPIPALILSALLTLGLWIHDRREEVREAKAAREQEQ